MPTLDTLTHDPQVRALFLGDSGSGKTGALASLAHAGYNLKIADFDNGLPILAAVLQQHSPDSLAHVDFESFRDKYQIQGDKPVPLTANAWSKGIQYIERMVNKATPDDVLVIDSLSFAAKAAFAHVLKLNGRLSIPPHQSDYGEAQKLIESLVGLLSDPAIKCNVICTAHVQFIGNEENGEPVKGFPSLIGKALGPIIPRYFNHALMARSMGQGNALKRYIHTVTLGNVELKNTNPAAVRDRYEFNGVSGGLAAYFDAVKGAPSTSTHAA